MPFSSTPLIFSPAQEPFPQSRPDIALKTFYLVTADSPVQRTHAFTSAFTYASQAHSQLGVKGAKKRGRSCTLVAVEKEKQAPERPFSQIRCLVIHKNTSAPLCSFHYTEEILWPSDQKNRSRASLGAEGPLRTYVTTLGCPRLQRYPWPGPKS